MGICLKICILTRENTMLSVLPRYIALIITLIAALMAACYMDMSSDFGLLYIQNIRF